MTKVRVRLGAFATEALTRKLGNGKEPAPEDLASAVRFYLNEKSVDVPGWAYPRFLSRRPPADLVELEMNVEDTLWDSLEAEASNQDVAVERLLEHALLYYAAELDAGRVTERILKDEPED